MNRRELGLGVATTSLTLAAANGALAQTRTTDPQIFIAGFDAQAGRLPAAQQADVRAVYQPVSYTHLTLPTTPYV